MLLLVGMYGILYLNRIENWQTATAIQFGAKYNPLIQAGEYWRLLTPSLLHFDLFHLLFNVAFIYQFGKMVEHVFGWKRLIVIFSASAFLGNLFSYAFVENVSLGASTVAYGLIGALLFAGLENRKLFMGLVRSLVFPILLFSLLWSFIDSTVDGFGHLGGFLGGFLSATLLGMPQYRRYLSRSLLAGATFLLLIFGLFARGDKLTSATDFSNQNLSLLYYHLNNGREDRAQHLIERLNLNLETLLSD
jgi:membrane associated rhomboid family serine protease